MKDKDKIIEILHSELFIVDIKAEGIADRILAIQEEEAQERYEMGGDHFSDMPKFRGTPEQISEAASEWIDQSFRIAAGLEPPTK